jgi:hypothetical protein
VGRARAAASRMFGEFAQKKEPRESKPPRDWLRAVCNLCNLESILGRSRLRRIGATTCNAQVVSRRTDWRLPVYLYVQMRNIPLLVRWMPRHDAIMVVCSFMGMLLAGSSLRQCA